MDELLALQKELAAVQSAPSVFRLAEPNVVEVMMKLAEFGLIEVLHTSNGKEYLTPKQLRNEVADEIFAHNGRINITELAPILNVDLPYIERAADELLKHDDGLQLFQGELIASYYLDSLAEEINQTLQGAGRITLAELAVQHTLPTDFMQKLIEPRLGTVVQAKLAAGVLYTTAYVARHAARVRGTLAAVLRPTSLAQLLRERGFNEALFYENVDGLKASCMLPGSLQGKSSYTPALHTHAQVAGVRTFYEQNGLIEYAALAKMAVRDPRAYLQSTYAGGIALETCYIRSTLLRNVEEEVEEACANKWALDVRAAFTHELTDADVDALLDASPSIKTALSARAVRLGAPESTSGLIASASLLAECAEGAAVDELVKGTAEKEFQAAAGKAAASKGGGGGGKAPKGGKKGKDDDDDDDDGGKAGKKSGGKRGKAAARDELLLGGGGLDDSDEEELSGGKAKSKGGKKGKKAKGGGGGGGGGAADADDGGDEGGGEAGSEALLDALEAALLSARPTLEEVPELGRAVAHHLLPAVQARIGVAVAARREAGAGERRKATQHAQESVTNLSTNLQLFAKGAASLGESLPPKDAEALDKATLKGTCTDLVVALLYSETLHAGLEPAANLAAAAGGGAADAAALSAAERKECLGVLPGPPQRALAELDRSLSAKSNVAAFLDALEAAEATLGAPCPPLDKKREKAAVDKARGAYRTPLAVESEPSVALHLTVLLLHLEINGVLLETSLPLKLLPPLIEALEPKLPEGPRGMLLACAKSALEVVLGGEGADGARDELRGGLEAVRSIGMSGGADAGGGNEESAPSAPKPPPAKRRMKKTDD